MNPDDEPKQKCENWYQQFIHFQLFYSEQDIAESKYHLHEAYCFRNVKRCPKCNLPVDKSELQSHEDTVHKPVTIIMYKL